MDFDLACDIFSFVPEKYFLSRALVRKNPLISFVDYERINCVLVYEKDETYECFTWDRKNSTQHQIGFYDITLYRTCLVVCFGNKTFRLPITSTPKSYSKYMKIFESYKAVSSEKIRKWDYTDVEYTPRKSLLPPEWGRLKF